MPIIPYLAGQAFDPETILLMSGVLQKVCAELGIKLETGRKNPAADFVAETVILHVQRGVRTEAALYEATMADFAQGEGESQPR